MEQPDTTNAVVLDWGWIRSRPTSKVPGQDPIVLADAVLVEAITTDNPPPFIAKLAEFLQLNHQRVLIGRYWDDMSREEVDDKGNRQPVSYVEHALTDFVRSGDGIDKDSWVAMLDSDAAQDKAREWEAGRAEFLDWGNRFNEWVNGEDPEWRKKLEDEDTTLKWIRTPAQPVEYVALQSPRYDTPRLRELLEQFPDCLAMGRAARIVIWYSLLASLGRKKLENCWEDAQYVFLATYTKRLATHDKGMITAFNAICPDGEIVNLG